MGLTRIELSGRVVKPPMVAVTPSGRTVMRLSVDCGEEPEHLLLDVVVIDEAARDLARVIRTGQRICATGALKALRRSNPVAASRQQIEVIASEIVPEQVGGESAGQADSVRADLISGIVPAKVLGKWLRTKIRKRFSAALSRAHAAPVPRATAEGWKGVPVSGGCAGGPAGGARCAASARIKH
jgi:hypothetical protein